MPWVYFTQPFTFHVSDKVSIEYRAGHKYLVKQKCADQAISEGKGELTERDDDVRRQAAQ